MAVLLVDCEQELGQEEREGEQWRDEILSAFAFAHIGSRQAGKERKYTLHTQLYFGALGVRNKDCANVPARSKSERFSY